jgi:hypothetical protein
VAIQVREQCAKVFKNIESVKVQKFKRPPHIVTTNGLRQAASSCCTPRRCRQSL